MKSEDKHEVIRMHGLRVYTEYGRVVAAYDATFIDCGKKGVSRCYTVSKGGVSAAEALREQNLSDQ